MKTIEQFKQAQHSRHSTGLKYNSLHGKKASRGFLHAPNSINMNWHKDTYFSLKKPSETTVDELKLDAHASAWIILLLN